MPGKKLLVPNDPIRAYEWNNNFNLLFGDEVQITYGLNGLPATVVFEDTQNPTTGVTLATTYTLTWDGDDKLTSYTDGTNTWTISYNEEGEITDIDKS